MAKQIAMRKVMGALRPCDGQEDAFNAIPLGAVMVEIKYANKPRSLRQHRLYWALMTKIAENTDQGWDAEDASYLMKIATGHFDLLTDKHGNKHQRPRSISFAAMKQDEFQPFMNKCIRIVCERIIPGVSESDLRNELEMMVS